MAGNAEVVAVWLAGQVDLFAATALPPLAKVPVNKSSTGALQMVRPHASGNFLSADPFAIANRRALA